jgi:aspartate 1-decarboxylase
MLITFCTGKLHRIHVTEARLDYEGSITIDSRLIQAAGIVPFQLVHINSMASAVHWETYVIPGRAGEVCLNGCPARLFRPGDEVIVLALGHGTPDEAAGVEQKVVHVDPRNRIVRVVTRTAKGKTSTPQRKRRTTN